MSKMTHCFLMSEHEPFIYNLIQTLPRKRDKSKTKFNFIFGKKNRVKEVTK